MSCDLADYIQVSEGHDEEQLISLGGIMSLATKHLLLNNKRYILVGVALSLQYNSIIPVW